VKSPERITKGNRQVLGFGFTKLGNIISIQPAGHAWQEIVAKVAEGDPSALEKLYEELKSLQFLMHRRLGREEAEDAYQELILDLATQIRRGDLRNPECLPGYARAIAGRKVSTRIQRRMASRSRERSTESGIPLRTSAENPESLAIRQEQVEIAGRLLLAMPPRDREVLIRFYLHEQEPKEIQKSLGMTENQFRNVKNRAKQRFFMLCAQRTTHGPGPSPRTRARACSLKTA